MSTFRSLARPKVALAVVAASALTLAACGSSSKSASSGTDITSKTAGSAMAAEFLTLKGVSTSVDLDAATLKVLTDNKVTPTPIAPATVASTGGVTTATFPISQGYVSVYPTTTPDYVRGLLSHTGGLKFTAGGKSLDLTDFMVNPGDSTLTATVAGGSAAPILDLDGSNLKISTDAQGNTKLDGTVAKLSQVGADALNKYFGVTIFSKGITLGVVHIVATGSAGPKGTPTSQFLNLSGANTSVTLDPGTLKVLTDNKVTPTPIAPATVAASGADTNATFPITQGFVSVFPTTDPNYIRGAVSHAGGLKFTAGGKSLDLTDFVVNTGDSTLTATVNGGSAAPILDIDGSALKISTDAQGNTKLDGAIAKLSQVGADALNKYFGVSLFKQGIVLGVVHVTAKGTPAPK
ncbi:MAG: hypothetical protein V7605_334 [Acidimicrobiaceae bacterium]|jgi:hypothetical protein